MKSLGKMVLSKKDKNLINDYIADIVHKLNCDLKIKFDWFKYSYNWFSIDLVKVEYEQDGTVRNEDSVWRKYKKLKRQDFGLSFSAYFSSTTGITLYIYFNRDDFKKLIRREKLKSLSSC